MNEGTVGGGTGMVCHEFKGGIGTASRVVAAAAGGWTVGVLVQANYGEREQLRIDGVPVGLELPPTEVPSPYAGGGGRGGAACRRGGRAEAGGSRLDHRDRRDRRAPPAPPVRPARAAGHLGLARMGSTANHSSGDLFLAFATGNRGLADGRAGTERR